MAGDVVGVEEWVLAEAGVGVGLAGVIPIDSPGMVRLMVILIQDMDLVTHTVVMAQHSLMATTPGKSTRRLKCLDK